MLHAPNRLGRMAVTAAVALAVTVPAFFTAAPAYAWTSPKYFDRGKVMARAKTWVDRGIPYSQTDWFKLYRTDCSGFVSMAWGLDQSYVTWSLPEVARPITKNELKAGDIMLNTQKHVVIFVKWADKAHTRYYLYEQAGRPHKAVARISPYPYDTVTSSDYKPYRYIGGHSLDAPGQALPNALMQTNAGGGSVYVPGTVGHYTNLRTLRIARDRAGKMAAAAKIRAAQKAAPAKPGTSTAEATAPASAKKLVPTDASKTTAVAKPAVMPLVGKGSVPSVPVTAAPAASYGTHAAKARKTADVRPPAMKLLDFLVALLTR